MSYTGLFDHVFSANVKHYITSNVLHGIRPVFWLVNRDWWSYYLRTTFLCLCRVYKCIVILKSIIETGNVFNSFNKLRYNKWIHICLFSHPPIKTILRLSPGVNSDKPIRKFSPCSHVRNTIFSFQMSCQYEGIPNCNSKLNFFLSLII